MTGFVSETTSRRQFVRTGVAVGLAGAVAGCSDGGDGGTPTPTSTPEPSLEIDRIQFVAERPTSYREYQPVEDKTYRLGGEAWVYFEPVGVQTESADSGSERIQLTLEPTFTDADGTVIKSDSQDVEKELTGGQTADDLFLWAGTPIPSDAATGTWQVEIAVTDDVSGATTTFTREFEVEAGEQTSYLDVFRESIESETDAEIQHLELEGATIVLEYESRYEAETDEWSGEIGWIGGLYAGFVGEGWSAERLSVTTDGSGGSTATWYVDRDDALAFINEEISNDEFGRRLFDTLSFE